VPSASHKLSKRVVEVLRFKRHENIWTVGSGLLVTARRVLTAAHNVDNGELIVRFRGKHEYPASICSVGEGEPALDDVWDLAIIEIGPANGGQLPPEVPPLQWARVEQDPDLSTPNVDNCYAIGFPRFREVLGTDGQVRRRAARLDGYLPLGEALVGGLLTFQVTKNPRPLPAGLIGESEWQGISGAAVLVEERVVAIISEHHVPEGESSLTVVPVADAIEQMERSDEWWSLLQSDPLEAVILPDAGIPSTVKRNLRQVTDAFKEGLLLQQAAVDLQVSLFKSFLDRRDQ
jgi:hypothetical protein